MRKMYWESNGENHVFALTLSYIPELLLLDIETTHIHGTAFDIQIMNLLLCFPIALVSNIF